MSNNWSDIQRSVATDFIEPTYLTFIMTGMSTTAIVNRENGCQCHVPRGNCSYNVNSILARRISPFNNFFLTLIIFFEPILIFFSTVCRNITKATHTLSLIHAHAYIALIFPASQVFLSTVFFQPQNKSSYLEYLSIIHVYHWKKNYLIIEVNIFFNTPFTSFI